MLTSWSLLVHRFYKMLRVRSRKRCETLCMPYAHQSNGSGRGLLPSISISPQVDCPPLPGYQRWNGFCKRSWTRSSISLWMTHTKTKECCVIPCWRADGASPSLMRRQHMCLRTLLCKTRRYATRCESRVIQHSSCTQFRLLFVNTKKVVVSRFVRTYVGYNTCYCTHAYAVLAHLLLFVFRKQMHAHSTLIYWNK